MKIEYYKGNKLRQETIFDYTNDNKKTQKNIYYDERGREIAHEFLILGSIGSRTDFYHDNRGNIILLKSYDLSSTSDTTFSFCNNTYDRDSSVLETKMYYGGQVISLISYSYYPNKLVKEQSNYDISNDSTILESSTSFGYDSLGNKTTISVNKPKEKSIYKQIFQYNSENLLTEEDDYKNDDLLYTLKYSYEKSGRRKSAVKTYVRTNEMCTIIFTYVDI